MRNLIFAVAISALLLASGCATVTRGTTQNVGVSSTPTGASIKASSGNNCTTPCSFTLKRNMAHTLTAELDGYRSEARALTPAIHGSGTAGMAGNIVIGGLIGAGVDLASGAMYDLTPNSVHFHMRKASSQ